MLNEKDSFLMDKVFSMENCFQDRSTVVVKSHHAKTNMVQGLAWSSVVVFCYPFVCFICQRVFLNDVL